MAGVVVAVLLAGGCTSTASSTAGSTASKSPAPSSGSAAVGLRTDCRNLGTCYTPRALRAAYGIQPLLDRGISGRSVTVVLLETAIPATSSPPPPPAVTDIRQDLALFDRLFGLPAAQLQVVNSLAGSNSPYQAAAAEVRDAEIVHAVAPDAAIRVILAGATVSGQFAALRLGITQGAVPAADPLVLAVGGTSLIANRTTGARVSEAAWNAPPDSLGAPESLASGGGFSQFARPSYQDGVAGIGSFRGVPDVSADADPTLGPAIAVTGGGQRYIVHSAGGTAAAAAIWAGLIALADQDAGHALGLVNPVIYRIGRSPAYSAAFHAVTAGTNTVHFGKETITGYQAASGWNPVTGWGSPNAQVLIPLLVRSS